MIHLCNASDIEEIIQIAIECYPEFDVESVRKWLISRIGNPDIFIAKGDHCAGLSFINRLFWDPKNPTFELEFICCRKTRFGAKECLDLIRYFNALRREMGYDKLWINSRLADLEPFVLKLGGHTAGKSWILEDLCAGVAGG